MNRGVQWEIREKDWKLMQQLGWFQPGLGISDYLTLDLLHMLVSGTKSHCTTTRQSAGLHNLYSRHFANLR